MPRPRAPTRELFEFTNRRRAGGKCDLYRCRRCGREMLENTHRFAIHISICKEATAEDKALADTQLRKTKKYSANMKTKTSGHPERPSENEPKPEPPKPEPQHEHFLPHQHQHQHQAQQPAHAQPELPQFHRTDLQPESELEGYHPRNYYHQYVFRDTRAAPMAHRQNRHYMFGDNRPAPGASRQSHGIPPTFQTPWGAFPTSSFDQARAAHMHFF